MALQLAAKKLTNFASSQAEEPKWYLIDAEGQILGRLAVKIADLLRGKNKPSFHRGANHGDYVVVINADKIAVSGRKEEGKIYYRHSGYPGGIKSRTLSEVQEANDGGAIELAVKRMLPRNKLRQVAMKRLKLYVGSEHPHTANKVEPYQL